MIIFLVAIFGFGLIFFQVWLYKRYWNDRLDFKLRYKTKEVFAGESAQLEMIASNSKLLPLPWLEVNFFPLAKEHNEVFSLLWLQRTTRTISVECPSRGFFTINNVSLTAKDVLYSYSYSKYFKTHANITVFPKLLDDREVFQEIKSIDNKMIVKTIANPDPFEFRGIREYQPTDALKNINFRASAIQGHLMTNMFYPTENKKINIILDASEASTALFEETVSLCATLANHYIKKGVHVGFVTNAKEIYSMKKPRIGFGNTTSHLYKIFHAMARLNNPMFNKLDPIDFSALPKDALNLVVKDNEITFAS